MNIPSVYLEINKEEAVDKFLENVPHLIEQHWLDRRKYKALTSFITTLYMFSVTIK